MDIILYLKAQKVLVFCSSNCRLGTFDAVLCKNNLSLDKLWYDYAGGDGMDVKAMLKKLFVRYGMMGANSASARGCYEPLVPEKLVKKVPENVANREVNSHKK